MRLKTLFLISISAFVASSNCFADDKLYQAIQKALRWTSYRFESHDFKRMISGTPLQRYEDRTTKGIMQRFDTNAKPDEPAKNIRYHWKYTVSMSEDYQYPLPGEMNPPLNGDFVILPGSFIDANSYQKKPGESAWRKLDTGTTGYNSVGESLANEWLAYGFVQNFTSVRPSGEFPIFGSNEVRGKKCILYTIENGRPNNYRFSYWLDKLSGDLVQMSGSMGKMNVTVYSEMTIVFFEPNKHDAPRITKP